MDGILLVLLIIYKGGGKQKSKRNEEKEGDLGRCAPGLSEKEVTIEKIRKI
jgi:hypothetical protein